NVTQRSGGSSLPAISVADAGRPGTLIFGMPLSYVYLTGQVVVQSHIGCKGSIAIALSDNHGLDWKEIGQISQTGEQRFDISSLVLRRYDYRLRLVLRGTGAGLDGLLLRHDLQHSKRALPALAAGNNTVTFRV